MQGWEALQLAVTDFEFRYCKRLQQDDFWGGELEILVLSKMLHLPIYVYRTAEESGL